MSALRALICLAEEMSTVGRQLRHNDIVFRVPQHFGLPMNSVLDSFRFPRITLHPCTVEPEPVTTPTVDKDGFKVSMDVSNFKPEDLTVKTEDDKLIIEGKHEERSDKEGFISRHFVRRFTVPKEYNQEEIASFLSSDGVLTVKIPRPADAIQANERIIEIQQTGTNHTKSTIESKKDKNNVKVT